MDRGLINRIVELQTRLSRLEGKTYIQFQVVRNNTIPLELLHEVMYYNYEANEFIYFNPLTRKSEKISIGSGSEMTFTDLVAILQTGTNVTLDVDTVAETITINSVGLSSVDWDDINEKPIEFPPSAHEHIDSEVELTETYTGNLAGATTQKDANDILDALVGSGGGGKEWQLQFFNQADIIQVEATTNNIASFESGVGTDVGTIEVSDDGVIYTPLVFPFSPSVGTWYFKRSVSLVTGVYTISE